MLRTCRLVFPALALAFGTAPLVQAQDVPLEKREAKSCFISPETSVREFQLRGRGGQCVQGARVSFGFFQANNFLVEQVCSLDHQVLRNGKEAQERVMCVFTGEIAEPERTFKGMKVVVGAPKPLS